MKLTDIEIAQIEKFRFLNPAQSIPSYEHKCSFGDKMADNISSLVGSWHFLIVQSTLLLLWLALNITAYVEHWDPYPFILLNLVMSFQAAYTAPIIMMSQNRESQIDRAKLEYYYNVNVKQELEIELLHQKMEEMEIDKLHIKIDQLLLRYI